jgi:transglutaminase-like putative cysteine protease
MIANFLTDRIDKRSRPSDSDWGIPDNGGGRRSSRQTVPGDENGQTPGLRGLSEHDWPGGDSNGRREGRNGDGNGDGESQQYTVMVVASKQEPVYMGSSIRGRLDPVEGFLPSPGEMLNSLPNQRFFVTWFDSEPVFDRGRERWEVFSLSTLPQKYLPYRPYAIEPTIQSENTGPFRYIHRVISNVHRDDPLNLLSLPVRELSLLEKNDLASYLEIPLQETDREVFSAALNRFLEAWQSRRQQGILGNSRNEYMEKILAILFGFSTYQYNVNSRNYISVSDLVYFLENSKEGDCVEFSNSAALLGRLAGIPSRVVTGYLAAEGLQTVAHLRGLAALRSRIPVLQQFPFDDLFLVTDAHGHAWPQFYIPDYGWVDFEATLFAIPPIGFGDANLRDVVIPLFDENQVFAPVRAFPWRAVLWVLVFLFVLALLCAYALRYGREAFLYLNARQGGRKGARSLYLLLLAKLAADGKPIKPISKTAPEYARLFPEDHGGPFSSFAEIYTELRWRTFSDKTLEEKRFEALKDEYQKILDTQSKKSIAAFIVRVFSLRGLAYL